MSPVERDRHERASRTAARDTRDLQGGQEEGGSSSLSVSVMQDGRLNENSPSRASLINGSRWLGAIPLRTRLPDGMPAEVFRHVQSITV